MAKRFTDTGKWDDLWFQELSNENKLIWIYLLDKCDMAGVWKVNKKLMEFCLGFRVDLDAFLAAAPNRITVHKEKWLIDKFINFQYGDITEANKVYRSVMSCLSSFEGNKGHLSPINGGKDKTKTRVRQDNRLIVCKECSRQFDNELTFHSHLQACKELAA